MTDGEATIYKDLQLLMQSVDRRLAQLDIKLDGVTMSMVTRAECSDRHKTLDVRCIDKHINVVDRREFRAGVGVIVFLVTVVGGAVAAYVKLNAI